MQLSNVRFFRLDVTLFLTLLKMKTGTTLVDVFAPRRQVSLDANSRAAFTCHGGDVSVWVPADLAIKVLS